MNFLAYRFLRISIALSIWAIVFLSGFSRLALAQEPAPVEIKVLPQAEYAVAGQPFTYTIVMTNISPAPVSDVIVFMETPTGTTFISASRDADWFVADLDTGQTGTIGWTTIDPIAPDEVVRFELSVNILPEMATRQLANTQYGIVPLGGSGIIASGPPVETQVLTTAPTSTPMLSPTAIATHTPTPSSTSTPTSTATTSATPTSRPVATPTDQPTLTPTTTSPVDEASSSATSALLLISLLGLGGGVIGLIWFLKRR